VHAAIGPIADVARGQGAELVGDGALDDEDELVADVTVLGQLHSGIDAIHDGAALRLGILP
jgi:hypothetical protein